MSGHRLGADVFRLQGRKSAWAVPLLLALAVVLVAALAVLFGFVMLGGAILFFRNRTRVRAPAKPFTWWQVLARALGVAFLVAVLIAWPRAIQAARERVGTQANATADGGTFTTVWPAAAAGPIEIFLLVAVLLAVARLAVDRLRVSRDDSATLTSLFEEARYSEHPLGDIDRARAINSLGRIRVALEG